MFKALHRYDCAVDGGFKLTESVVVVDYLDSKYGKGTGLTPSNPQELAEVFCPALDAKCWVHAESARQSLVQSQVQSQPAAKRCTGSRTVLL